MVDDEPELAETLLADFRTATGGAPTRPAPVTWTGPAQALPARLPVTALATGTVAAAATAAAELVAVRTGGVPPAVTVDRAAVATAFTSERHLRVNGESPGSSFAPLSGFWRTRDGWVRTHANYPHHRRRLLAALGIAQDTDDEAAATLLRATLAGRNADEVAAAVTAADGLAVAARTPAGWAAHAQGAAVAELPLLALRRLGDAAPRPLPAPPGDPLRPAAGLRVLDLTRVIAGPVGTRTLALLGADVLRVDSPRLPELPAQQLDTGFGKRSTLLDLAAPADRATFDALLAGADVLVTGYRPGALARFGLTPGDLAERYPGLVVATLSAWSSTGPWARRRGFDSLVQVATGIAAAEAGPDGERPGALPAQALDHGTGYLLAAAVLRAVAARHLDGGSWHAELSLAQTAGWLLDHGGAGRPGVAADTTPGAVPDPAPWLAEVDTPAARLRYALSPVRFAGSPATWTHPAHPLGADPAAWA
ncbi:CoA transferase [Actinocatenispora thailandica]|uniref:CoA transferase n=1 Tax=Actinocatenispora thailandica TaxID=227318 RepID=A0A7R7DK79_9ACTN|nr:CoA transferase [Actinocatenispora thailandica]BCJ33101.1 CoA transferase [Actinocatenispora thailandica]